MGWHYKAKHRAKKDNSPTPKKLYDALNAEFQFNFDPCPLNTENLRDFDGLGSDWGTRTYVNPPYSKKTIWINKAIEECKKGKLVVMLLPVDTSTNWFHDLILPNAEVRWIRGRIETRPGRHAMYASMLAIFRPKVN